MLESEWKVRESATIGRIDVGVWTFLCTLWKCPDVSELNVPAATSPAAPPARILETLMFEHIFYSGNLAENIEMHLSGK